MSSRAKASSRAAKCGSVCALLCRAATMLQAQCTNFRLWSLVWLVPQPNAQADGVLSGQHLMSPVALRGVNARLWNGLIAAALMSPSLSSPFGGCQLLPPRLEGGPPPQPRPRLPPPPAVSVRGVGCREGLCVLTSSGGADGALHWALL